MKYFWMVLALAACGASPAPEFIGAKRVDLTIDGRDYAIFSTQRRVQVIRLGYAGRGQHALIRAQMIALIPQATGCRVIDSSLRGDSGQMRGSIVCPKE